VPERYSDLLELVAESRRRCLKCWGPNLVRKTNSSLVDRLSLSTILKRKCDLPFGDGRVIRALREYAELSRDQCAVFSGIPRAKYWQYEGGNEPLSVEEWDKLVRFLVKHCRHKRAGKSRQTTHDDVGGVVAAIEGGEPNREGTRP
jgi:hypothetical protein